MCLKALCSALGVCRLDQASGVQILLTTSLTHQPSYNATVKVIEVQNTKKSGTSANEYSLCFNKNLPYYSGLHSSHHLFYKGKTNF